MNFNYNELLREQLYRLQETLSLTDYDFEIESEQEFIKRKDLKPNTIYVLLKYLQNDIQIGVNTQPVQLLILTEQNSLDISKAFFSKFAIEYNFNTKSYKYGNEGAYKYLYVKQQYTDPVVLSNFNTVDYGYRSVLYMSVNLYITDDVVDLHDLKIDSAEYKALTWDLSYSMTPNTQQTTETNNFISKSTKSVSSLAITLTLPVVQSALTNKVLSVLNETDTQLTSELTYGGNEDFVFDFYLGSIHFENKSMKLVSCQFGTAIDNIPVIRLGFVK